MDSDLDSPSPISFTSEDNAQALCIQPRMVDISDGMKEEEPEDLSGKERSFSPENLKFSIQNILRPDFGCNKIKQERLSPSLSFVSSTVSPRPVSEHCGGLAVGEKPRFLPTDLPAWVFCTRYSDRPSSGKNFALQILDFRQHQDVHWANYGDEEKNTWTSPDSNIWVYDLFTTSLFIN